MGVENLDKAKDATLKSAYERDFKTQQEKKDHVHRRLIDLCGKRQMITGIYHSVIDLAEQPKTKHDNVAHFLKWAPKRDARIREWLTNKNSGQEVSVLRTYGLR